MPGAQHRLEVRLRGLQSILDLVRRDPVREPAYLPGNSNETPGSVTYTSPGFSSEAILYPSRTLIADPFLNWSPLRYATPWRKIPSVACATNSMATLPSPMYSLWHSTDADSDFSWTVNTARAST